jgi:hypothetical protein
MQEEIAFEMTKPSIYKAMPRGYLPVNFSFCFRNGKLCHLKKKMMGTVYLGVLIVVFLCSTASASPAEAGMVLPRMGAMIELDQVTPKDPWEDRSSRLQWVFARLHSEGLRVWLLDPQAPVNGCEVIYLDGPHFMGALTSLKNRRIGILQSANRMLLQDDSDGRMVGASSGVSLKYHSSGRRRVVTVAPDLADCFDDDQAVRTLANAILWLAGLPEDAPRIAPFPNGKRSAVVFIVHGEGNPQAMVALQRHFFYGPGALTYSVSEDAIRNYPLIVKSFAKSPIHEVAVHNHVFTEYGTQDRVLSANVRLHEQVLEGHRPKGLIGPYLRYFDDLREALVKHHFSWYLDKDLPYPLNIPGPADAEPIIDITESLKPYDGWWKLEDAVALWRQGLTWKRLRREIAVCSWHDVHMGMEPQPFLEFMRYVKELPDVWQTTALNFQAFWRDRWRARVEIVSNEDRHVTLRASQAPPGLTLLRRVNGRAEIAILMEGSAGLTRLEWKPLESVENTQGTEGIEVKWSPVGSIMPRNGLDTEFAVIHPGEKLIRNEMITLRLPEALRARIGRVLPTTLRVSTYGLKGLKFKDIEVDSIAKDTPVPATLSFKVDILPGQSIRFYRLRFPISEKAGRLARWEHSLRKRPIITAVIGAATLIILALLTRKILFPRKLRPGGHPG